MLTKGIIFEDFVNYKEPSMYIAFPNCDFKCEKECGIHCCQNSDLVRSETITIDTSVIIERYLSNPITSAIVCGGLEPMDSWDELLSLIKDFREVTNDMIVIYTGYKKEEIKSKLDKLRFYKPITIKFGRFIPNQERHFDPVLGVMLSSDNQCAEII